MATKAELVNRTLWRLRARGTGQIPAIEDSSEVSAIIDDKLADLAFRHKIYIADSDDLPDGSMDWLSRIMEMTVASAFGVPENLQVMAHAEAMLLSQRPQDVPEYRKQQYF